MKPSYGWLIREIKKSDNKIIREVLQSVMKEFRVPEHGTALMIQKYTYACCLQRKE